MIDYCNSGPCKELKQGAKGYAGFSKENGKKITDIAREISKKNPKRSDRSIGAEAISRLVAEKCNWCYYSDCTGKGSMNLVSGK